MNEWNDQNERNVVIWENFFIPLRIKYLIILCSENEKSKGKTTTPAFFHKVIEILRNTDRNEVELEKLNSLEICC